MLPGEVVYSSSLEFLKTGSDGALGADLVVVTLPTTEVLRLDGL